MSDEFICDSPVTIAMLQDILQKNFQLTCRLKSCDGVIISKGLGFTSDIIRVKLQWDNDVVNADAPLTVIIKAPSADHISEVMQHLSMGQKIDQQHEIGLKIIQMIHESECRAYKALTMENQQPPLPLPSIYGYSETKPGFIVMEDLGCRAGVVNDFAKGLNLNQWKNVVVHLADLHAWSLNSNSPWKEMIGGLEKLREVFNSWETMAKQSLILTFEKYSKYLGTPDIELYDRELVGYKLFAMYENYRHIYPDVMQHGDTWTNNILFEKDANGNLSDHVAAFIDWQISFAGCGLNDVARLSCFSVNHEIRRQNQRDVLKIYFDRLTSNAAQHLNGSLTFERMYKIYSHSMAIHGLLLPTMADFLLKIMAQTTDENDPRFQEIIARTQAAYQDALAYFRTKNYDDFEM